MFEPTSRYYNLATGTLRVPQEDGSTREVRYVLRRFIPPAEGEITLLEHTVREGDRLDNITARYIGDPEQFWRLCDANVVLRPEELTDEIGNVIRVMSPQL